MHHLTIVAYLRTPGIIIAARRFVDFFALMVSFILDTIKQKSLVLNLRSCLQYQKFYFSMVILGNFWVCYFDHSKTTSKDLLKRDSCGQILSKRKSGQKRYESFSLKVIYSFLDRNFYVRSVLCDRPVRDTPFAAALAWIFVALPRSASPITKLLGKES